MLERAPVTLALAVLCLLLCGAGEPMATGLAWDRAAILHGQAWRLWTGHLVHYSVSHAAADAVALLAMGVLAEPMLGARRFGIILAGGAAAISAGLLVCVPGLAEYRGASGLAMLAAALAGVLAWRYRPGSRRLVAGAVVLLVAKFGWEGVHGAGALADLPPGVAVAWQAHLLGSLAGACAGVWRGNRAVSGKQCQLRPEC
jgi:rhomboid family GlyGly-CTERM serine protease